MLSYSKSFRTLRSHTENLYDRARRKLTGSFRHSTNNSNSNNNSSDITLLVTNNDCSNNSSSLLFVQNNCLNNEVVIKKIFKIKGVNFMPSLFEGFFLFTNCKNK